MIKHTEYVPTRCFCCGGVAHVPRLYFLKPRCVECRLRCRATSDWCHVIGRRQHLCAEGACACAETALAAEEFAFGHRGSA